MARRERRKGACCLVSEFLEEAGVDREGARRLVRQLLEGVILMCRWQLERMRADEAPPPRSRGARRVTVE
jgi:sugar (pentulose or hexulose) kinase